MGIDDRCLRGTCIQTSARITSLLLVLRVRVGVLGQSSFFGFCVIFSISQMMMVTLIVVKIHYDVSILLNGAGAIKARNIKVGRITCVNWEVLLHDPLQHAMLDCANGKCDEDTRHTDFASRHTLISFVSQLSMEEVA